MTKKRENFIEALEKENKIIDYDFELSKRSSQAKVNISNLIKETENLKAERPKLLADGIDVSNISTRLKKIEEEIEINQDTITGIEEKRKSLKIEIHNIKQDTKENFQNFVEELLEKVGNDYTKIAKKLSLIMKEYITLENIYYGEMNYTPKIKFDDIRRLPNLNGENPIFENKNYDIYKENDENIREKYKISDYYVKYLRLP